MTWNRAMVPLVLLLALAVVHADPLTPKLRPTSDDKFFGKPGKPGDYPTDSGRGMKDHFDFPFPAVQDHEDYDTDYVKDENRDGGEWKANDAYDRLRKSLHGEIKEVEDAKVKVAKEQAEYDAALAKQKAAEKAHGKNEADLAAARQHEEQMEQELAKVGGANADGVTDEADREVTSLEDCKKKLMAARERLKKLLDEREKRKAEKAAADKALADAEKTDADADKSEDDLEGRLADAEKSYALLLAKYEKELAEYEKAQSDLDKLAAKLRVYRRESVDQGQGVYYAEEKSGAAARSVLLAVAVAVVAWTA